MTKKVMLTKLYKVDYTAVKIYQEISLLNCLGGVYKKVTTNMLVDWCEVNQVLH